VASDSGVIVPVKQGGRGGNQVAILHPDGSVTVYSHTSSSVKIGDKVAEGEPIGCTDASGNVRGGGNHVHYMYFPRGLGQAAGDPTPRLPPKSNYPKNIPSSVCGAHR